MQRFLAFIGILFTWLSGAIAQAPDKLRFEHITTREGLPSDLIRCLNSDSRGFLWIGTDNGLVFFDGVHLRVFKHDESNPYSLPSNRVNQVKTDRQGNLWLATDDGLALFDEASQRFHTLYAYASDAEYRWCHSLMIDRQDRIWFSCRKGLGILNPSTRQFRLLTLPPDSNRRRDYAISHILEDTQGRIWIGSLGGLWLVNPDNGEFKRVPVPCSNFPNAGCFQDNSIMKIYEDRNGGIWLGTWGGGLKSLDPATGVVKTFIFDTKGMLGTVNVVLDITERGPEYGKNLLWLATGDKGVLAFDTVNHRFYLYSNDPADPTSLSGNFCHQFLDDGNGSLWVATEVGLNKADRYTQRLKTLDLLPPNCYQSTLFGVSLIQADKTDTTGHRLLVGHEFHGLSIVNRYTGELEKYFDKVPIPPGMKTLSAKVWCMTQDSAGYIWFASAALNRLNRQTGKIDLFLTGDPSLRIFDMTLGNQGNLWLATNKGLVRFNTESQQAEFYQHEPGNPNSIRGNRLRSLFLDSHNKLWLGIDTIGIDCYDPATRRFSAMTDTLIPRLAPGNFAEDSHGHIYASTPVGLLVMDPASAATRLITTTAGLIDNRVFMVLADAQDNFYAATSEGLSFYHQASGEIFNFTQEDGLYQNGLSRGFLVDRGELFLGYERYMQAVPVNRLSEKRNGASPRITGFRILEKSVHFHPDSVQQLPYTVSYHQNILTFEYAAPLYSHTQHNQYAYKLEGFDGDWIYVGSKMSATYTNLDGGDYTFRVRAANADGIWAGQEAVFRIRVLPPFWKTTWFRLLAGITIAAIVLLVYILNIRRIRREERKKTEFNRKVADAEMKALRAQMNPHFIFNCLNTIDAYILRNEQDNASRFLHKFSKLVRMVLENSGHKLVPLHKDLEALDLYIQLEQLRCAHAFDYRLDCPDEIRNGPYKIPPLLLQPYIENAILHGLRHKTGKGLLTIRVEMTGEDLLVSITDNGIGRKKAGELKAANRPGHQSMGMKVTHDRIDIFNFAHTRKASVRITDLLAGNGEPNGTRVDIVLPVS